MAAYTSSQNGNWSSPSTWGGAGVPGDGDTASVGHNITVDVNTTVGTSPNSTSTAAVTWTAAKTITIAANVTFTVKGNLVDVFNLGVLAAQSGATLNFDNSSSGGTPLYGPTTSLAYQFTGTVNSPVTITAPVGRTHGALRGRLAYGGTSLTYVNISRMGAVTLDVRDIASAYDFVFSNVGFSGCNLLTVAQQSAASTKNFTWDNVTFSSSVDSSSLQLQVDGTKTSGTRRLRQCVFDKPVVYVSKGIDITQCVFLGGINVNTGYDMSSFRLNFSKQDGTLNSGNGAQFTTSLERNYFVVENLTGNPHFVAPTAKNGADNLVSQNIFEGQTPDLIDVGDCILVNNTATSGGKKVIGKNNITLPMGYSGTTVTSGTLVTLFNLDSASVTEWYRNTANVNNTTVGGVGTRGMFAVAEGNTGTAGQVAALKSNLAWGSSSGQGYLGERVTGNVKDIFTAAGADYNWRFNSSTGDNQRGYEDKAASNTLWTAGDAVAAGVDTHQGSGDPQFYDSSRNLAAWATARGYGSTYANALTALQADPTRTADLIAYIFEGMRPGNASCRNAAHDGACVGAANFYKSSRKTTPLSNHRARTVAKFGA